MPPTNSDSDHGRRISTSSKSSRLSGQGEPATTRSSMESRRSVPETMDSTSLRYARQPMSTAPAEHEAAAPEEDGPRSLRGRHGGGFLLPSTTTSSLTPPRNTRSSKYKGKEKPSTPPRASRPASVLSSGSSPLASNVINAKEEEHAGAGRGHVQESVAPRLDLDSTQIVNLALNLSQSRKQAARRSLTNPALPAAAHPEELGGSLKQHLQQQRRVSRNISPRASRTGQISASRDQTAARQSIGRSFEEDVRLADNFSFSASTLHRAEKAKTELELMAQYRRLLQYLPPLKMESSGRPTTARSATSSPKMSSGGSRSSLDSVAVTSRAYNPLQYIRNRRLRLRGRAGLDGEAQGLRNVVKVTEWVDRIAETSLGSPDTSHGALPSFASMMDEQRSPHTSPPSRAEPAAKPVRPRIDWMFKATDLLADMAWVEEGDNIYRLEDRHGHPLIKRPLLSEPATMHTEATASVPRTPPDRGGMRTLGIDLKLDTRLPDFKSVRATSEGIYDKAMSKAKDRFRDAAHVHHGQNGSGRTHRQHLRSHSRSDSSDSEADSTSRRNRDPARSLLEKQMAHLMAKEASTTKLDDDVEMSQDDVVNTGRSSLEDRPVVDGGWQQNRSKHKSSSGRTSSEVLTGPKSSVEDYSIGISPVMTRSTDTRWKSIENAEMASLQEDSPSGRRTARPKIVHSRSASHDIPQMKSSHLGSPNRASHNDVSSVARSRSTSPNKEKQLHNTSGMVTRNKPIKGHTRWNKSTEQASAGIRGLFKHSRGPMSKMSDLIWRKDGSTMQSAVVWSEQLEQRLPPESRGSAELYLEASPELPSTLEKMPAFQSSQHDARGRKQVNAHGSSSYLRGNVSGTSDSTALAEAPPTFVIQNPSPQQSPEGDQTRTLYTSAQLPQFISSRDRSHRTPSDVEYKVYHNPGAAGAKRGGLPVTGLASLEVSSRPSNARQWSISDRASSISRGPLRPKEVARIRCLLINTGVKAKEILRQAHETRDPGMGPLGFKGGNLQPDHLLDISRDQVHARLAQLACTEIEHWTEQWRNEVNTFMNEKIPSTLARIELLHQRVTEDLMPMSNKASDEAGDVSMDLVSHHTLQVQQLADTIGTMLRKRRRRFRWLRRGGWVLVEWLLLSFMWWVWLVVVLVKTVCTTFRGVWLSLRWLLWL